MKTISSVFILLLIGLFPSMAQSIYHRGWIDFNKNGKKDVYEDPTQPIERRVEDLLHQMNLNEKTCQLATLYGYGAVLQDRLPTPAWKDSIWKDGIANIDEQLTGLRKDTVYACPYSAHAKALNEIQRFFVEQTRLGIPVDFTTEGIRGLNHMKATYFPAQIAQACAFDTALVYQIGRVTGREARALGYTNVYAPILDVASDPRWGRTEETYGCDPFLIGELGKQAVRGLQDEHVVSTCKHFAVYSIPIGGRDGRVRTDPQVPPHEMEEIYLHAFREAFQKAGALGTMASYNDYDGVPIVANKHFLTDILRKQFGFKGYVVSDSRAVEDLVMKYHVASDEVDAARQALEAGLNVRTDFSSPSDFILAVRKGVQEGKIPMSVIDERVREVLYVKFWLGLFDHPYVSDPAAADTIVHSQASQQLALKAAHEGIVLLKNEGNLLPLDARSVHTVALIGPNMKEERSLLSRYGPVHARVTTLYDGITAALPATVKVLYAEGCHHVDAHFPESDIEYFPPTPQEEAMMDSAVAIARQADIVILAMGDNNQTVGESRSRVNLKLPGLQDELVRRIAALHKPTILLLVGGKPFTINFAQQHIPAIVECWYLGEQMGTAVADVLFGKYNPSGKLCMPFPKSVGQIPLSFPLKPAADAGGNASVTGWLYPFGYGLSYTTFAYSHLKIDSSLWQSKGQLLVSCTITNTGTRAGTEIAQLYIHDELSSVTTYVEKLRGFARVSLQPGESQTVTFILHREDFKLLNASGKWVLEPGWFDIWVGASSADIRLRGRIWLK
ncbi:MAG: glycoside hydrolase family 3 C-terminal domain-containing protein [Thermoflavifilum sp.]|uniref:glycoside hydrolase family 3 N-terminal domain-containing protein n=1 Tax=Thermoflavifilum sp. TaxID=1968839 RepID=UPI0018A43CA7|nr:glycoside hydrolase family 3 N-terminal domain-containing protein [Thermoflavifilum sp.]QOR75677.1 MAG: glycoside hydrolase family 3 C-terminal domain-containing protein [Thermoflavifilum sp.]